MKGKMKNFGADWGLVKADGNFYLDVRIIVETEDGAVLHVEYPGICLMTEEQKNEFLGGSVPDGMTLQVTPKVHTLDERYTWLNDLTIVGKGTVVAEENGVHVYYSWYSLKV